MGFYNQPENYTSFLDIMNLVFTVFFTFEFTVKLAGFGFKEYFKDPWNTFDFVIVIGSFLDIIMANLGQGGASVSMLRLFRAMRLVKLLAKGESIRQLLYTFIKSFQVWMFGIFMFIQRFFKGECDWQQDMTTFNGFQSNFGFGLTFAFPIIPCFRRCHMLPCWLLWSSSYMELLACRKITRNCHFLTLWLWLVSLCQSFGIIWTTCL